MMTCFACRIREQGESVGKLLSQKRHIPTRSSAARVATRSRRSSIDCLAKIGGFLRHVRSARIAGSVASLSSSALRQREQGTKLWKKESEESLDVESMKLSLDIRSMDRSSCGAMEVTVPSEASTGRKASSDTAVPHALTRESTEALGCEWTTARRVRLG